MSILRHLAKFNHKEENWQAYCGRELFTKKVNDGISLKKRLVTDEDPEEDLISTPCLVNCHSCIMAMLKENGLDPVYLRVSHEPQEMDRPNKKPKNKEKW